jgi:hypothetical protein
MEEEWLEDDPQPLPDDLEAPAVDLGAAGRNWLRPPAAPLNPATDALGARQPPLPSHPSLQHARVRMCVCTPSRPQPLAV